MFGLMKPRTCGNSENKLHRHLTYCGTCKTLGNLYGQKTRFLLNHDTVFLAELLTVLSGKINTPSQWEKAYHSYNCFSLPKNKEETPIELQLAATATVVLTEYKVVDHITDTRNSIWKFGQRIFSKSFYDANNWLKQHDFPIVEMQSLLGSQSLRELEASKYINENSSREMLEYLAEPTAKATALFFEHGATLLKRTTEKQLLYQIGYSFGSLVYLLDAYEDYAKDHKKQEFNALRVAFKETNSQLSQSSKTTTKEIIYSLATKIKNSLSELAIEPVWITYFSKRLDDNLSIKFTGRLPVLNNACQVREQVSFSSRRANAFSVANRLVANYKGQRFSLASIFSPFIFLAVLPIAFLFPNQAARTSSYKECLSISFNLIFLGSLLKQVLSLFSPKRLFRIFSSEENSAKKRKSKSLKSCACCSCGGTSILPDCCDCACCACEGLECCAEGGSCCECCGSCGECGACGECCGSCGECGSCC